MVAWWGLLIGLAGAGSVVGSDDPVETSSPGVTIEMLDELPRLPGALGPLPPLSTIADDERERAKTELGRLLFFDTRLSRDEGQSCASCHDPAKGFSDGRPRAVGRRDYRPVRLAAWC